MKNVFKKWHTFFSSPSYSRTFALIGLLILLAAIPITLIFLQQRTNILQHAESPYICHVNGGYCSSHSDVACEYSPSYNPNNVRLCSIGQICDSSAGCVDVSHLYCSCNQYDKLGGSFGCWTVSNPKTPADFTRSCATNELCLDSARNPSNGSYTGIITKTGWPCVGSANPSPPASSGVYPLCHDGNRDVGLGTYCQSTGFFCVAPTSSTTGCVGGCGNFPGKCPSGTYCSSSGQCASSSSGGSGGISSGSSGNSSGGSCPDIGTVTFDPSQVKANQSVTAKVYANAATRVDYSIKDPSGKIIVSHSTGGDCAATTCTAPFTPTSPGTYSVTFNAWSNSCLSNTKTGQITVGGSTSCTAGATTSFVLSVKLQGIGTGSFENNTPARPTRTPVYIKIADEKGNFVYNPSNPEQLTYTNGLFMSRQISLGTDLTCGHTYTLTLKLPTYLPVSSTIAPGVQPQTISLNPIAGDINGVTNGIITGDGSITVNDYALVAACRNQSATATQSFMSGSSTVSATCGDLMNFIDYPDGGTTGDEWSFNYNLWLRGFLGVTTGSCTDSSGATIQPGHECSNKAICESGNCTAGCAASGRTCDIRGDTCPSTGGACVKQ